MKLLKNIKFRTKNNISETVINGLSSRSETALEMSSGLELR